MRLNIALEAEDFCSYYIRWLLAPRSTMVFPPATRWYLADETARRARTPAIYAVANFISPTNIMSKRAMSSHTPREKPRKSPISRLICIRNALFLFDLRHEYKASNLF